MKSKVIVWIHIWYHRTNEIIVYDIIKLWIITYEIICQTLKSYVKLWYHRYQGSSLPDAFSVFMHLLLQVSSSWCQCGKLEPGIVIRVSLSLVWQTVYYDISTYSLHISAYFLRFSSSAYQLHIHFVTKRNPALGKIVMPCSSQAVLTDSSWYAIYSKYYTKHMQNMQYMQNMP